MATKIQPLKKPTISTDDVLAFAERSQAADQARGKGPATVKAGKAASGPRSGLVPTGDVRLTANIRGDLHLKLKIRAAQERTTVGELIERWVDGWKG